MKTPLITIAEAKQQIRLEADFTDDDAYIEGLITAAQKHIQNRLDAVLVIPLDEVNGRRMVAVDDDIQHAAKLLVSEWHANREATGQQEQKELPLAVSALLAPHINPVIG